MGVGVTNYQEQHLSLYLYIDPVGRWTGNTFLRVALCPDIVVEWEEICCRAMSPIQALSSIDEHKQAM